MALAGLGLLVVTGCESRPGATSASMLPALRVRTLADAVAAARPGDTITLPSGTYEGGLVLPSGVVLRGAGPGKTIVDARGAGFGLAIEGGKGNEVADLWVRGASRAGIVARNGANLTIRRVRASGSLVGIQLTDVVRGRIENAIGDDNRYGITIDGGRDVAVINCTLADASGVGLSLARGERLVAFNNCIAGCVTGVALGESLAGLRLDHNLYDSPIVGKVAGQLGRKSLGPWRSLSGQDEHSVALPVTFRNPASGDFRPSGTLAWALDRAATTDWGATELAGVAAPAHDADEAPRVGRPDAGAFESAPSPVRPPDGRLTIRKDAGIKAAGLFAPGGRGVGMLFQDLPLPHGVYSWWFPARDVGGRPFAAGTYELKTVESDLECDYLGGVGDTGAEAPPGWGASSAPLRVAFDGEGRLVLGQGRSEDATGLRGYDAASGRQLWALGGRDDLLGLAAACDGMVYVMRPSGTQAKITRVDPRTGKLAPWGDREERAALLEAGAGADGLAELDGRLFVTGVDRGAIRFGPSSRPDFSGKADVPLASSPAADPITKTLWVIAEGRRVVALGSDGAVLAESTPVAGPAALAARGGRLAVASRSTGKVHLFDARAPATPRPLGTIGTGDGPFGPLRPDRFLFQGPADEGVGGVHLALGPRGELAVVEGHRLAVFDARGKPSWSTFGLSGQGTLPAFEEPRRQFDADGRVSLRLDEQSGTWSPEALWDVPASGEFLGTFADGGRTFGAFVLRPVARPGAGAALLVVRYAGFRADPVLLVFGDPRTGRVFARKDSDRDGRLDGRDASSELLPPGGEPASTRGDLFSGTAMYLQPDGGILALAAPDDRRAWAVLWRRHGLDADGVPVYRLEDRREIARRPEGLDSPYTSRPDETRGLAGATLDDRGGLIGLASLRSAPGGTGPLARAGTDIVGLDPGGGLRWILPMARHGGLEGLTTVGAITLAGVGATNEVVALNRDGLGLGSFGPAARARYAGSFLDGPRAVRAYRGRDGRPYVLVADPLGGLHHWWRILGEERIVASTTPITLREDAAQALAALPPAPAASRRPPSPVVRVPRLDRPFPIDGDLEKWRKARIAPQVAITPETAAGDIEGARDVCAVARIAYRDDALYFQVLTFDDAPRFHQPLGRHHLQDGVEITINGYLAGFQFDVARTLGSGPIVLRRRYRRKDLDLLIGQDVCPRIVKVLEDARDVPERQAIEAIYGVDLAGSPVIVTELKLPIDERTYRDAPNDRLALRPGQAFRLGFLIDDNDDPGTDVQNCLVWPAGYSPFHSAEDAALAVLE